MVVDRDGVRVLLEIDQLLGLPELQCWDYRLDGGDLILQVAPRSPVAVSPCCGTATTSVHQRKTRQIRDISFGGRRVFLDFETRRFGCSACGGVFQESYDFVGFRSLYTRRYREYIFERCRRRPLSHVAEEEGLSEHLVEDLYYGEVERRREGNPWVGLEVIGLDEISLRKGQKHFKTVISDGSRARVLDLLGDRKKKTVIQALKAIPKKERAGIRTVTMDMCEGFFQAVREALPRAKVVVDRFHVMKALNEKLSHVRRKIQRGLSEEQRKALKGLRWILVRNQDELDREERRKLRKLYRICPDLAEAHDLKEEFRDIYEVSRTPASAERKLATWMKRVRKTPLKELHSFVETLQKWKPWILNYFEGRWTNGRAEGLNNKIKMIKRRGFGYRNDGHFRLRLVDECNGGQ